MENRMHTISSFRCVLYVVCFLSHYGSCYFEPNFSRIIPYSWFHSTHIYLPMKMEQTECSETSAFKLQAPGKYPKESLQRMHMNLRNYKM